MADGFVHTVHKDGRWVNEIEGGIEVDVHETKQEAVDTGRELARAAQTEHVIHNVDGTFAERNSYGNDPVDRPG